MDDARPPRSTRPAMRHAASTSFRVAWLALCLAALAAPAAAQPVVNPREVVFLASSDHAAVLPDGRPAVAEYRFELYVVGAPTPFHAVSLGKPAPGAGGLITYDFSSQVATWPLPGGTYEARVAAVGPGGIGRSAPSNPFTIGLPGCTFTAAPAAVSLGAGAGSASVTVTTTAGCGWTAASGASWITVSPASGAGGGAVTLTVVANPATTARTGSVTVAGQTVTVTQAGGGTCVSATSPATMSVAAAGGAQTVAVTAPAGCVWAAASGAAWITVSPATGTGGGGVALSIAANPGTTPRTGTVTVAGYAVGVTQAGATCTFGASPTALAVAAGGASAAVALSAGTGCAWEAASGVSWLAVSPASGSGSATVRLTIAPNTGTSPRTGTVTAAGRTITVTQSGVPCAYAAAPTAISAGPGTGAVPVEVTTAEGCAWTATSSAPWATLGVAAGTGSDSLAVMLAANTSTATRYATVTVAGLAVRITQAGVGCTFTVSPPAITAGSLGTTAHVTVMAPAGCGWSASSPVPWVALSPTAGSGSTTVRLTFSDNATDAVRTASLMVAGQQVTVQQSRRPKPPGGLKVTN